MLQNILNLLESWKLSCLSIVSFAEKEKFKWPVLVLIVVFSQKAACFHCDCNVRQHWLKREEIISVFLLCAYPSVFMILPQVLHVSDDLGGLHAAFPDT